MSFPLFATVDLLLNGLGPVSSCNCLSPMPDYKPPFAYGGRIKRALGDVSGTPVDDLRETMREILARQ